MAKKKDTNKPLTQKELKAMLAETKSTLKQTQTALDQAEKTYSTLTTPSPAATVPADLTRSKVTGLSPVQQAAREDLQDIAASQGGGFLRTSKSAGQVVAKPTTVLPQGQEWKWFPTTGGGGSWKAVQTSVTPGAGGGGGGGGGPTGPVTTYTAPDGKIFTDLNAYNAYIAQTKAAADKAQRQSAYDLLFEQFNQYGLGGLVTPLRSLIESGINPAEFTIKLRETDAYKKRFAANAARINKGLRALSEAEYIGLEDQYQDVMRRYGLPQDYYTRGEMGRQEGFEKFIGGDVSPVELEDRIQTAQRRVLNAAPQIKDALTQYYGNEISNGDILAYVLDSDKAIENIKRKVTAAEIGAGAAMAGLGATKARAEELGAFGVTGEQARQGFQAISSYLPRAQQLGDIYAKQGMGPFTQMTAEAEVFGTPGATDAAAKRRKLTELEQAQFGGSSGAFGGALARERAGQF